MDQFEDGNHVRLRSRARGTYLHADENGVGVSLSPRRASLRAAWAVHLHRGEHGAQYVLLHSAAHGRYLAATDAPAPFGIPGFPVVQRHYDQQEVTAIRWQAVRLEVLGYEGDIMLRQVGTHLRYLRANGRYRRWIKSVSVDEVNNITDMMYWVVEHIPPRQGMPGLPAPIRNRLPGDFSVVVLRRAAALSRTIRFVRAGDDGHYYPDDAADWIDVHHFTGRSVRLLRYELANSMRVRVRAADLIMCVRAGRYGRLTPLVVNLPHDGNSMEIVLIMDGTPASAALRHPDVNAE